MPRKDKENGGNIVQRRPAETTTLAGYVALLIAKALGLDDPDLIIALAGVIAFIPTVVTWIVSTVRG